jgi:menaquinone-specific isochorismate synthase
VFALESEEDCFIGASPERLVKKSGKQVFSVCLAGSIARGNDAAEDESLGLELLNDPKNRIEHDYVVQMIKAAMEKVCSTYDIPTEPSLIKMKDIQHLFTPVTGSLKNSASIFSLIELLHPTPALGGYPQKQAIKKIREAEILDRGLYGAPIGWLDYQGNGEFAVSIRSALIQKNEASLFAGCGVVKDSDAESEFKETAIKFKPMLSALGGKLG